MEDHKRIWNYFLEKAVRKPVGRVQIRCTFDTPALELVGVSAIDDEQLVEELVVFSIENPHEGLPGDLRDGPGKR
jgi:hypothetical protein